MSDSCGCVREPGAEHRYGCIYNPSLKTEYAQRDAVIRLAAEYDALRETP